MHAGLQAKVGLFKDLALSQNWLFKSQMGTVNPKLVVLKLMCWDSESERPNFWDPDVNLVFLQREYRESELILVFLKATKVGRCLCCHVTLIFHGGSNIRFFFYSCPKNEL